MQSLKIVLTLLIAALWPLLTMHCTLESLPGLDFLACALDVRGAQDCNSDGCETVEQAAYKVPHQDRLLSAPALLSPSFSHCQTIPDLSSTMPAVPVSQAPPELLFTWHLDPGTAPPPRAPAQA